MKVLCVIPTYWPAFEFGGPIHSVHNLNRALARKGVDVTVYTTNKGLENNVTANREVNVDGVRVTYFEFTRSFEFLGSTGWHFSPKMTWALRTSLYNYDLVHINAVWNYPTAASAFYSRKYKKPYILSPRGMLYSYTLSRKSWKKLPYYQMIAKRDVAHAAAIHYTTMDESEKCAKFTNISNRSIIVPNGIALSEFHDIPARTGMRKRFSIPDNKTILLYLGRINWKKGFDVLAESYGRISRKRDDVHLLIAGPDEDGYKQKVKKLFKAHGLRYVDKDPKHTGPSEAHEHANITFTGLLNGKDRLTVLSESDIFILPSYSENFGVAVIEAMACKRPVIISDMVGIHKEVAANKAGIIIKTIPDDLYNAMNTLIDNRELNGNIAANGRRMAEEYYDIEKVADMMIVKYGEIAGISV